MLQPAAYAYVECMDHSKLNILQLQLFSNSFTHHIFILSNDPIFRYDTLSLHILLIKFFNNLIAKH